MKTDLRIYCTLLLELLLSQVALCTPTISGLKVTPIEPLGLAIDYNVSGAEEKHKAWPLEVSMRVGKKIYTANVVSGATLCENGAHRVYWNVAKDGITLGKTNMDVVVTYKYTPTDGALYCVIDLSGGPDATSYPIKYFDEKPSGGFNTTEYKTTKLVLKRVDAGTFIMGSDQTNESHRVTLTKPFYMGLYEVTQKQWELVMGTNPSYFSGEANPVECVSYDMIRGAVEGAKWPATNSVDATSFLGKLRDRTKLDFDLPTEAQWEYTCRAGTTTEWSYGDNADGDYMWYWDNSSLGTKEVGSKLPNKWGFYDMHGNALEWCLDWRGALAYGADPKGSSSGSYRVLRGGCWAHGAFHSTSSYQDCILSSFSGSSYGSLGFRLSRTLP